MIVALLFLILFAILFPKFLRFLFALLFIGMIVALGQAHAGYDCHDGKFDDCTAQWSRDHSPSGATPLCLKWPCENGDTPSVDDFSTHRCRNIKNGGDVSIDEIDRLAPVLKGKVYSSDCAVGNYIAKECKIHPAISVEQAINALSHKAMSGEPLPDIPRCGA